MIEKLKELIEELAKEIISSSDNVQPLFWKEKAKKLYELLTVYTFIEQQKDKTSVWETQQAQFKSAVSRLENVSLKKQNSSVSSEEDSLDVAPLMDTINDILTEMPDQTMPEELFQDAAPSTTFDKKESVNEESEEKEEVKSLKDTVHDIWNQAANEEETREDKAKYYKPVEEEKKTSIIEDKPRINDRFSKDLKIDLNDRIAFIKHLFNNENSDYQRVIRQIFTYSTLDEAKAFINEMVKPEYNNWLGKDTYEERFLRVIELYFDPPN